MRQGRSTSGFALPVLAETFWHAPLAAAAIALTAGIIVDHFLSIPPGYSLFLGIICLLAWLIVFCTSKRPREGLLYLALSATALGAAYNGWRHVFPQNDLLEILLAREEPWHVNLRGYLEEEPSVQPIPSDSHLRALPPERSMRMVFQAQQLAAKGGDWMTVTGRVVVFIKGEELCLRLHDQVHFDDLVELAGLLTPIQPPSNPGERDFESVSLDAGIRLRLLVTRSEGTCQRLERHWSSSPSGWLAQVRNWGTKVLERAFPSDHVTQGLAIALILGDGTPLGKDGWRVYQRTGIIHVLVISGSHLVLLAWVWLWILPRVGFRQRQAAVFVAVFLILYVCLTGVRPPSVRSMVTMTSIFCGLVLARRYVQANVLALAWIVVIGLNPSSIFDPGCQLSFLCILVLYRSDRLWGQQERPALDKQQPDPRAYLQELTRPPWAKGLRTLGTVIWEGYRVSLLLWLAVTPLVAYHYHNIPLVAILLGPPVAFLTGIALAFGFLLLLLAAIEIPVAWLPALPVKWSLAGCEWLVGLADRFPGSYLSVPDLPFWWVALFYTGLMAWLTLRSLDQSWRGAALAAGGWLCLGLLLPFLRVPTDELRCTFLAVGHGGCTVLETPDGRTILYDAGSLAGPDVVQNQIAPYLWHRGIRRIDDLILSHADLDHFNGLPALLELFAIGQVIRTPSFQDKEAPGVQLVLDVLEARQILVEVVKTGDKIQAGEVVLEVLHPPRDGPEGKENVRSLTLLVQHKDHRILLTGDLEGEGLSMVMKTKNPRPIDVLMAPHHGSKNLDTKGLVEWAGNPWVVISSQGRPRGKPDLPEGYRQVKHFLRTWDQGAVTVRCHSTGLIVETFLTKQRLTKPAATPRKKAG